MKNYDNHFLFSETYIIEYIRNERKKEEVLEEIGSIFSQIKDWYIEFETGDYSDEPWFKYIDAVLDVLRFNYRHIENNNRELIIGSCSETEQPVAICHYVDKQEDIASTKKGKYYAYNSINAAKKGNLNWAILTNGKLWRIYYVKDVSPYECYLEINLNECINKSQINDAFILFYLIFNSQNFSTIDGELKIDKIRDLSNAKLEYIENSLRCKAEAILKELCYGLIEDIKKNETNKEFPTIEEKKEIYEDAIVLLFRLIFLGYAESRNLLPKKENDPEYIDSFSKLCADAKNIYNEGKIDGKKDGFEFWVRLDRNLRIYVNERYNGGLFKNDNKPILKNYRIADGRLTKCLAELSYNKDKNGKYVEYIDYKDLSIRNLGSIYEGLLEYRLQIADERMVQRKSKGKLKYLRAAEVKLQNSDFKYIIEKGDIYLSQESFERKETGAYYTPEDVVDYIVKNTVGMKLYELKEELKEREKNLIHQLSYETMKSQKRIIQKEIDNITIDFIIKKILSISIMDSAMGSGHFLVNAAYLIANEIVDIIYQNDWESDIDELNGGINQWKRRVVENCIYGIDINGLSVNLAKLSLWLISATNDKALSFLDHHIKEGNSILGTDSLHVKLENSKFPILDVSFEDYLKPILLKYREIKVIGSATIQKVSEQNDIYIEINEDIKLVKKKYDYYLAKQYLDGIKDEISYGNLLRSKKISEFYNKKYDKLWEIANEKKFFHWELEFPEVFEKGGFDITIGNPPYVEVNDKEYKYSISQTIGTKNLYSFMIENNIKNIKPNGHFGFIVPLSSLYAPRMCKLKDYLLLSKELYISNYAIRPGKIFKNVEQRVSIINGQRSIEKTKCSVYTTKYIRWYTKDRKNLFNNIKYQLNFYKNISLPTIPKIGEHLEIEILEKVYRSKTTLKSIMDTNNKNKIFYHSVCRYWIKALDYMPDFYSERKGSVSSSKYRSIYLKESIDSSVIISVLNSSLFYWYWILFSEERDLTLNQILEFPFDYESLDPYIINKLKELSKQLMMSYKRHTIDKTINLGGNVGIVKLQEYHPKYSKSIIDEIDDTLGKVYGLNLEEMNFIKNYDISFRMGADSTEEAEEEE
jgi:hypothetical protein